jgi:hypothetical protein
VCKYFTQKGKLVHSRNLILDINREYNSLNREKYLGTEESEGIQHQQMQERLKKEYTRRLRMILKSELNARNKITATGTLDFPVLRQFYIINWRLKETIQIERKITKTVPVYKIHHPKARLERLHVKMKLGGRGLLQIETTYKAETINIAEYLNIKYKEDSL